MLFFLAENTFSVGKNAQFSSRGTFGKVAINSKVFWNSQQFTLHIRFLVVFSANTGSPCRNTPDRFTILPLNDTVINCPSVFLLERFVRIPDSFSKANSNDTLVLFLSITGSLLLQRKTARPRNQFTGLRLKSFFDRYSVNSIVHKLNKSPHAL